MKQEKSIRLLDKKENSDTNQQFQEKKNSIKI